MRRLLLLPPLPPSQSASPGLPAALNWWCFIIMFLIARWLATSAMLAAAPQAVHVYVPRGPYDALWAPTLHAAALPAAWLEARAWLHGQSGSLVR
jgi:hypothetical protein